MSPQVTPDISTDWPELSKNSMYHSGLVIFKKGKLLVPKNKCLNFPLAYPFYLKNMWRTNKIFT